MSDYFLRKFALDFVRDIKIKDSHLYAEAYWQKTKIEEFLAPFFQLFLIPTIMFSMIHFEFNLYIFADLEDYYGLIITVSTFLAFFLLLFILLFIGNIFFNKERPILENVYRVYCDFTVPFV